MEGDGTHIPESFSPPFLLNAFGFSLKWQHTDSKIKKIKKNKEEKKENGNRKWKEDETTYLAFSLFPLLHCCSLELHLIKLAQQP